MSCLDCGGFFLPSGRDCSLACRGYNTCRATEPPICIVNSSGVKNLVPWSARGAWNGKTMTIERLAKGVLMVGSVPLSDAEEVFRTCAGTLSDRLTSLPDGETGARLSWLGHQRTRFDRHPQLERFEVEAHIQPGSSARYRVKAGSKLRFDSLGYSEFARNSYAIFQWLQSQSVIRESIRFQVRMLAKLRRAPR